MSKLAALMDDAQADVLAYMGFPAQHRAKLHSTNPLERLNGKINARPCCGNGRCAGRSPERCPCRFNIRIAITPSARTIGPSGKEHHSNQVARFSTGGPAQFSSSGDRVVLVTSVNRLTASSSHFAGYVEAPTPEHKHEAHTSERTLTPAWRRHRS